jgi:2OG-Fe(II) oxygenase superfamily
MSFLTLRVGQETAYFDASIAKLGTELRDEYQAAQPFPYIVIDNFLPEAILDRLLLEWPDETLQVYNRVQERLKFQYNPEDLKSTFSRSLFYAFNAAPFIKFVQNVTGISGLLPDPYFNGGGFHETKTGGHISVHADFNLNKSMRVRRRINVIVYLNKDWRPEYAGNLELWSKDMKTRLKSVEPVFNRCLIFNTDDDSFHGHPDPLTTPEGLSRRSLALYYYTASDAIFDEHRFHTTIYKARPKTTDKLDYKYLFRDFMLDLTPPFAKRILRKVARRAAPPPNV